MADVTLKDIKAALMPDETLSQFAKEYKLLTEKDKEEIKSGLTNGTLTY